MVFTNFVRKILSFVIRLRLITVIMGFNHSEK